MKKANVLLFSLLLAVVFGAKAQQVPLYAHYFFKPSVYNPAYTGDKENAEIFLVSRQQFIAFNGAPLLNVLVADGRLMDKKSYLGVFVADNRKGITSSLNGLIQYAYRFNLNEDKDIYFKLGLAVGVFDQSINYNKIQVQNTADPHLFASSQRKTTIDGNAGLLFYAKGFQLGISVPQIVGDQLLYKDEYKTRSFYQMSRHYLASLRYDIPLNKEKEIYLTPNGIVRFIPNAPLQFDGGLYFDWKEKFWIGGTYRSDYAVGINAGVTINRRFSVGYSYDYMIGSIAKYAGMAHELMFSIKLGKLKPRPGDDTLTATDKKIIDLQSQIDELKKNGTQPAKQPEKKVEKVQASPQQFTGKNVTKENGVYILTNHSKDFVYSTGTLVPKGYYIVVGSYFYKDYAESEARRYHSFGFPEAEVFIDKVTKFHYVFVNQASSKQEAFEMVKQAKDAGVPDVWIQVLVE